MVILKMVFLFTTPLPDDKDVIAIDGKTLRHSYDKSRRRGAIHVISAFSTMHSLVIGQIKTDEKSNEITAIPELLNMLDIKGKIITTDAMGCQKDIAEKIQKQGGDYLFAVKKESRQRRNPSSYCLRCP